MRTLRRALACGVSVLVLAGSAPAGAQSGAATDAPGAATASSPVATARSRLADVDRAFFSAYEHAVQEVIRGGSPALLVVGSEVILYEGGNRATRPILPAPFDELKAVAHVALGLFAVLSPSDGAPLDDATLAELQRFRTGILAARDAIAGAAFSPAQRTRQEQIVAASLEVADRALDERRIASADLTAFARRVQPLMTANVDEAVVVYLDAINRAVGELLPQIPATRRPELLVLVTGVHQARIDNAAVQYFERLLGDPTVLQQRVIYAENVRDERGALHLLGIHLMARRVGDAFFADPTYMNSDLFGRAAKRHVPQMTLPSLGEASAPVRD